MDHKLVVEVPLPTERAAVVATKALDPDPELRPLEFKRESRSVGNRLIASFEATTARSLRVGVNNFFDSLASILETIDELAPSEFALSESNGLLREQSALEGAERQEESEAPPVITPLLD